MQYSHKRSDIQSVAQYPVENPRGDVANAARKVLWFHINERGYFAPVLNSSYDLNIIQLVVFRSVFHDIVIFVVLSELILVAIHASVVINVSSH